eukprot:CAMPEP_0195520564 /NCGR_PEP_ID=MMETSP0794_2-20130614/17166_1 /TAXON_ID=515487 /ORGANISM="Stephanopyxis turris, Strain CCMP 815" /LENGTH=761 /DNA_ID=CAMNT_0040649947 /DNA_START=1368 /DNA_END=3654 /DNA_ORIENTATION=+
MVYQKDVKDQLQQLLLVPQSAQRLFLGGPLQAHGRELPNHRTLHDAGIYVSGETLLFDIKDGSGLQVGAMDDSSTSNNTSALGLSLRTDVQTYSQQNTMFLSSSLQRCDVCVSSNMLDVTPKALRKNIERARRGFALGLKPELVLDGSGGTYFLHGAGKVKVGVFKPADEEPYAMNNPRGYVNTNLQPFSPGDDKNTFSIGIDETEGMSLRAGISPGEACLREVAAFLLDHGGFSGVPMTTLVESRHPAFHVNGSRLSLAEGGASIGSHSLSPLVLESPTIATNKLSPSNLTKALTKIGSFQDFVKAECSMDDLSPSKISAEDVHKIAILDIRLMNADRNLANLLVRRKTDDSLELVPIDHGYCLRSVCDVAWFDWCWLDWPQLKQPISKTVREYILNLDVEKDVRLLKERFHIGAKVLDIFRASSKLLQAGVKARLSLYDIALMCCRNDDAGEIKSKLELMTSQAVELATAAVENEKWGHTAASSALVEKLSSENPTTAVPAPLPTSMRKSVSSVGLSSISFDAKVLARGAPSEGPTPPSVQTSGSDSSSDAGDVFADRKECDEWAASLIADVSMDVSGFELRNRSLSEASLESDDDSEILSSSPKGFWHTRPGSPSDLTPKNLSWSPCLSPKDSATVESLNSESNIADNLKDSDDVEDEITETSPISVLPPLSASNIMALCKSAVKAPNGMSKGQCMVRSQSYSAFSFRTLSNESDTLRNASNNVNPDQVRTYTLKFIDLLITKETLAAAAGRSHVISA